MGATMTAAVIVSAIIVSVFACSSFRDTKPKSSLPESDLSAIRQLVAQWLQTNDQPRLSKVLSAPGLFMDEFLYYHTEQVLTVQVRSPLDVVVYVGTSKSSITNRGWRVNLLKDDGGAIKRWRIGSTDYWLGTPMRDMPWDFAEPADAHEPPPRASVRTGRVVRTLDSLPAPVDGGGR
jgi:hypothetical protein